MVLRTLVDMLTQSAEGYSSPVCLWSRRGKPDLKEITRPAAASTRSESFEDRSHLIHLTIHLRFHFRPSNSSLQLNYISRDRAIPMKLIVAGATGFVASEVIRQAVRMPEITSIIALARRPITVDKPESSKIKNVVIKDYGEYPEEVKKELAGADACIW